MKDKNRGCRKYLARNIVFEIEERKKALELLKNTPVNLIKQCFPQAEINLWGYNEVDVWLPFQFELIQIVKDFMAVHTDYKLSSETRRVDNQAVHCLVYKYDQGLRLEFNFSTNRKGTTCVLHQIGTEIIEAQERPIYEVICQDGAKEGGF